MKISTLLGAMLFIGVIFFIFAMMINEGANKYNVDVNNTVWEGKYDYAENINSSMSPLINSIDNIADQDKGWLEKVGSGFTGIIAAVTLLPKLVWNTFAISGELITGGFTPLHIPQYIIMVILISVIIWGVFKLVEFFQRWPT